MSTASSVDPERLEDAKQQIRELTGEIDRLCREDLEPGQFYQGFLDRIVSALAAVGGAVWTVGEHDRLGLAYQVNLAATGLSEDEEAQARHGRLLVRTCQTGDSTVAAPKSGDDEAGNPTSLLVLLGVLKSHQEVDAIVEIFQRPAARPALERNYLRFLTQMCELAGGYLKNRALRHFSDRQALWAQLEQYSRAVHQSLNPTLTAYTIVNEGRRLIGCDRVSIVLLKGRRARVEAVSGEESLDRRSTAVTLLSELAATVTATGDGVWYSGDTQDLAPQVEQALQAYVDESHSKTVAVLPLRRPAPEGAPAADARVLGALVVEQIEDSALSDAFRQRVDVVAHHGAAALANAIEHHSLFLLPVWKALGRASWVLRARTAPKLTLALAVLVGAIVALCVVPADFALQGRGTLEPVVRREVFASIDGVVDQVYPGVEHGQTVHAGQELVKLRNTELDVALTDIRGRLASTEEHLRALKYARSKLGRTANDEQNLAGQILQLDQTVKSLSDQQKLYERKEQQLIIRSPIDGQVVTWQVRDKLIHRPVERGQVLLTVADPTQEWELHVYMPESRMGHIGRAEMALKDQDKAAALPVSYILATDPGVTHEGRVQEIHGAAEVRDEEGATVLLRVAIDQRELSPDIRPGATVTAKVHCGRKPIGYVWFHDVIAFVQSKVLFRF